MSNDTTIRSVPELVLKLSIHVVNEVPHRTVHWIVEQLATAGESTTPWGVLETYTQQGHKRAKLAPVGQMSVERQAWWSVSQTLRGRCRCDPAPKRSPVA